MVFSRKYSRNFVSLNQESAACNLDFRPCIGKCILEIRENIGKLTISVQGLNPEKLYKICLISVTPSEIKEIQIGYINIDETGKGELKTNFNPDNINNSNLKIEDISLISVIVQKETEIKTPLVGYIKEEITWKDKYTNKYLTPVQKNPPSEIKDDIKNLTSETKEEIQNIDKPKEISDISTPNQNPTSQNTDRFEEFNNLIEKFKTKMNSLEETELNIDKEIPLIKNPEIEYIKSNNPEMTPFNTEEENIKWYRISPEELAVLDKDKWKYINNQFIYANFKKYKHLMLGIKTEENKEIYLIAIPCKFQENFKSKDLKEFNKFLPVNKNINKNSLNNEYGYRIL